MEQLIILINALVLVLGLGIILFNLYYNKTVIKTSAKFNLPLTERIRLMLNFNVLFSFFSGVVILILSLGKVMVK